MIKILPTINTRKYEKYIRNNIEKKKKKRWININKTKNIDRLNEWIYV